MITNHPRETPDATACRGRPPSAAADTAIIKTVLRLLEEGATIGEPTIEGIARSADVGKATIYRQWPGKGALLMDVLRTLDEPTPELPGRSVRDDLVLLVEVVRRCGTPQCCATSCCSSRTHPSCGSSTAIPVILVRRTKVLEVLQRGIDTGEIRGDVDLELLGDLIVGSMLSRDPAAGLHARGGAVRAAGRHGARRSAPARVRPVPTSVPLTSSARQSQNHRQHWRPPIALPPGLAVTSPGPTPC